MYVKQYGQGERTFLAFHGWGGDHRDFAALASRLPSGARLLSCDLPGYGRSPPPASWDVAAVSREIILAADKLQLKNITLVGFCSGAVTAMCAACSRPALAGRLVMIDPFAYVPWYFRIFLAGALGRQAYRVTFASPAGRGLTTRILRRRQATDDNFMGAFARVDHRRTLQWLALLHRVGRPEQFAGLTMPIDLIHGERTFRAVRKSVQIYSDLWPQARTFELRGVGHLPLVRGARQIARILY